MHRTTWIAALAACAAAIGPAGCESPAPPAGKTPRVAVVVSIPPQACFVRRIGGEHVEVQVLVGPGQQPHTFEPTLKQMARMGAARLYFRVGVPFEETLARKLSSTHRHLEIVDTRKGIELRPMPAGHDHEGESPGHRHADAPPDPHTWMSPRLAKLQSQTICAALCRADPAHEAAYRAGLAALSADLDALDAKIAQATAPLRGRTFYVFHPAFGYFAAAYGLRQKAVETGGKAPGAKHVKTLIDQARAEGVRVLFVQPQFSTRTARTIAAEIGGAVVPIDPLAEDYLRNLEHIADEIRQAVGDPKR